MSFNSSLQIGRTGLLAHSAALQVTGNNLANMATPGYHRQDAVLAATGAIKLGDGLYVGRGVMLNEVTREINEALEARLRNAISDEKRSGMTYDMLTQIESIQNEFQDVSLSNRLGDFFDAWSNLANNPQDQSLRTLVLSTSTTLANHVKDMRGELGKLGRNVDTDVENTVGTVNDLLNKIEDLNARISLTARDAAGAPDVKDQRDLVLAELAEFIDISVVMTDNGVADVYVGSLPVILNGHSRGVEMRSRTGDDGQVTLDIVVKDDQSPLDIRSGELGAMVNFRNEHLNSSMAALDEFAALLINEVNKLHAGGHGTTLWNQLTSTNRVDDTAATLDSKAAALPFDIRHGSFQVHVTQVSTGQRVSSTIDIDLDGINAASDTTFDSLVADLDAVANLNASINPDGTVTIQGASSDFEFSFTDDSSGALAALGINTFFTGGSSTNIGVNQQLVQTPGLVATALDPTANDNQNALAIAALRDAALPSAHGLSLTQYWNRQVEDVAVRASTARSEQEADTIVRGNLTAQQQSISGVNVDEESIDLLQFQRGYQASARFLTVVDELLNTLLSIV